MDEFKKLTQFNVEKELYDELVKYQDRNNIPTFTKSIKAALNEFFFKISPVVEQEEYYSTTVKIDKKLYRTFKVYTIDNNVQVRKIINNEIERIIGNYSKTNNKFESKQTLKDSNIRYLTVALKTQNKRNLLRFMEKEKITIHELINTIMTNIVK